MVTSKTDFTINRSIWARRDISARAGFDGKRDKRGKENPIIIID
jgi:hypothetical protein